MKEKLLLISSYIENQLKIFKTIFNKIKQGLDNYDPDDERNVVYVAYELNNFYSSVEDLFVEIAKTFENAIEDISKYHIELLKKMKLNIKGIRPALISDESYKILNELRKFRHIFRHAYEYELQPSRVKDLAMLFKTNYNKIIKDVNKFKKFLEKTASE